MFVVFVSVADSVLVFSLDGCSVVVVWCLLFVLFTFACLLVDLRFDS